MEGLGGITNSGLESQNGMKDKNSRNLSFFNNSEIKISPALIALRNDPILSFMFEPGVKPSVNIDLLTNTQVDPSEIYTDSSHSLFSPGEDDVEPKLMISLIDNESVDESLYTMKNTITDNIDAENEDVGVVDDNGIIQSDTEVSLIVEEVVGDISMEEENKDDSFLDNSILNTDQSDDVDASIMLDISREESIGNQAAVISQLNVDSEFESGDTLSPIHHPSTIRSTNQTPVLPLMQVLSRKLTKYPNTPNGGIGRPSSVHDMIPISASLIEDSVTTGATGGRRQSLMHMMKRKSSVSYMVHSLGNHHSSTGRSDDSSTGTGTDNLPNIPHRGDIYDTEEDKQKESEELKAAMKEIEDKYQLSHNNTANKAVIHPKGHRKSKTGGGVSIPIKSQSRLAKYLRR